MAGRGFGKTRTGGGWIHKRAMAGDERRWIMLAGATPADARDLMIEGPAGILRNAPPWEVPKYEPSKRRLTWPTGAWATVFSGAHPEQFRGFSGDTAWLDELAAWAYPRQSWEALIFGMREGDLEQPQICITTTPKPIKLLRELVKDDDTALVRGSSYENLENLHPTFRTKVLAKFEGTTTGQQEIYAVLLEEDPRAHWKRADITNHRVTLGEVPDLVRVGVAIDPAVTATEESDETGIMVGGVDQRGHGYLLDDLTLRAQPLDWASVAIKAYDRHKADIMVAEVNNGGDMVETTIRTASMHPNAKSWRRFRNRINFRKIFASRGKFTRAEPVAGLYQRGLVHHVGVYDDLEDQMCTYIPNEEGKAGKSPDRYDAMVWLFTELMVQPEAEDHAPPPQSSSSFAVGG